MGNVVDSKTKTKIVLVLCASSYRSSSLLNLQTCKSTSPRCVGDLPVHFRHSWTELKTESKKIVHNTDKIIQDDKYSKISQATRTVKFHHNLFLSIYEHRVLMQRPGAYTRHELIHARRHHYCAWVTLWAGRSDSALWFVEPSSCTRQAPPTWSSPNTSSYLSYPMARDRRRSYRWRHGSSRPRVSCTCRRIVAVYQNPSNRTW